MDTVIIIIAMFLCLINLIKIRGRSIASYIYKKLNIGHPDKKRYNRYLLYYRDYIDENGYVNNKKLDDLEVAIYEKFKDLSLEKVRIKKKEFKARIESHVYLDFGTYTAVICSVFITTIASIFSAGKMDIEEFGIITVICLGIIFFGEIYRKYLSNDYGDKRSFFIICYDILEELEQKQIMIKDKRKGKSLRKYMNKR